ncbi:nucleotidyltransferase domain-containing protein [Carnobacteriaceae bacterium zg-ZUI78]|nr:nucleotidyltransferase domain-containing protein [Carnobacteriaceae bacterium zg-ZUI78]
MMNEIISQLAKKYKIKTVYLFGSQARNEADEESDIDIVIDNADSLATGFAFFTFQIELEEALGKKVDLLTEREIFNADNPIGKEVRKNFLNERVIIYEDC